MGAAQVSARQTYVEEAMQKSDFPKLKSQELSKVIAAEALPPKKPETQTAKVPGHIWISVSLTVVQLCLFIATILVIYKEDIFKKNIIAKEQTIIEKSPLERPIQKKQGSQDFIANFDGEFLKTSFQTPIRIANDDVSKKALKLSLDPSAGFGKKGKSLKVDYSFFAPNSKSIFLFEVPATDIETLKHLSFYFRNVTDTAPPQITVVLIGANGKRAHYKISDFFSFWKKYELEIDLAGKELLQNDLAAIEFHIETSKPSNGSLYLDDLSFVR